MCYVFGFDLGLLYFAGMNPKLRFVKLVCFGLSYNMMFAYKTVHSLFCY